MSGNQLHTIAEIAERAKVDRTTIHYRAQRLGIEPEQVAGKTRLFSTKDAERLVAGVKK